MQQPPSFLPKLLPHYTGINPIFWSRYMDDVLGLVLANFVQRDFFNIYKLLLHLTKMSHLKKYFPGPENWFGCPIRFRGSKVIQVHCTNWNSSLVVHYSKQITLSDKHQHHLQPTLCEYCLNKTTRLKFQTTFFHFPGSIHSSASRDGIYERIKHFGWSFLCGCVFMHNYVLSVSLHCLYSNELSLEKCQFVSKNSALWLRKVMYKKESLYYNIVRCAPLNLQQCFFELRFTSCAHKTII